MISLQTYWFLLAVLTNSPIIVEAKSKEEADERIRDVMRRVSLLLTILSN